MLIEYLALVALAGAMAYITAALVKWAAGPTHPVTAAVLVFLLVMMAAMLGSAVLYYLAPSPTRLVEALWLSAVIMSLAVFPLFWVLLREAEKKRTIQVVHDPGDTLGRPWLFVAAAVGLVFMNELLMGWAFSLAAGAVLPVGDTLDSAVSLFSTIVVSPWFVFTMAAEMTLTSVMLWNRIPRALGIIFLAQSAIMFLSPPVLADSWWIAAAVYGGSAAMTALFVFQMEYIYRHRQIGAAFSRYTVRLIAVYALMMAGLFVWLDYTSPWLFAASIVLEMVLFFEAVLSVDRYRTEETFPWQLRPSWAFQLLLFIFIAELFMGACLDLQLEPSIYSAAFPTLPLAGSGGTILANALSNGFWFVALVTGSTWFLAMMGLEMGALFYFKFRETRNLENRIRMVLTMGSYAIFATFFPSIYFSALFPNLPSGTDVPVLGWSMGVGSAPLAPALLLVVVLSYAVTGPLCALFGRRVICSTFCTPALMYQGTAINAMSSFNRTSTPARKYLGSHFSKVYSVTNGVVMASLVGASFVSYFDAVGTLNWTVAGADPTVFLFALSFGVLWFVLFVTIPYTGNYNCVTMGWCYTGTIAQAFQKIGFFKLKVRDKQVCRDCTTLDCAKSCPVGLVDMVGFLRTTGEFRSSKCCGVGNCVGSCPYGNLYIHDVRHWVRRRLGRPDVPPPATSLPMIRRPTLAPATSGGLGAVHAAARESKSLAPLPDPRIDAPAA